MLKLLHIHAHVLRQMCGSCLWVMPSLSHVLSLSPSPPHSLSQPQHRYCLYPQELVLRIDPAARIRKLQLLSHQYMIASKIELFVGQLPSDAYTSIDQAQFTRLGYVSLSDNEQTGFRVSRCRCGREGEGAEEGRGREERKKQNGRGGRSWSFDHLSLP